MRGIGIGIVVATLCGMGIAASVSAQTLRWGSRGDAQSMDPYAANENITNTVNGLVYESLVERDRQQKLVPSLAASWTIVNDLTWRFALRKGVTFHDGTPFSADDVVFSIERAQQPSSQFSASALALGKPVAIDASTVELRMAKPDPILLEHVSAIFIMSRAWCKANKAERVPSFNDKEESYSSQHALGTGPYVLKRREPGVRTEFSRHPAWWGRFEGNVQQVVFTPIESDATRVAALLSGDINFTPSAPTQDADRLARNQAVRLTTGPENRIIFFGMDQFRDELPGSGVKGNPLKDVRVREALFLAIDAQAIQTSIMRGQAVPTSCMATSPLGCPATELETRAPADPARARRLMAVAGYAQGFDLTLDCTNDRYVNDQSICVALVGMLGRIGVRLKVQARSKNLHFPKVMKNDTSFYIYGWGGGTLDPQTLMDPILHGWDEKTQRGGDNGGRVDDPELNHLIEAAAVEMNPTQRTTLLQQALRRTASQFYYLPLHRPSLTWLSGANVHPVILPSNQVKVQWVRID